MTTIKPDLTEQQIRTLLQRYFDPPIAQLTPIAGGHISRTVSFRCADADYILRLAKGVSGTNFAKEAYISQRLTGTPIPVPTIKHLGRFEGVWFAISNKLPGVTLDSLPPTAYDRLTPAVIQTLDAIHQIALPDQSGYGPFDSQGVGLSSTWPAYLRTVIDEEDEDGFYGRWHTLFEQTFLERNLFERIYDHLLQGLAYCPAARYLVHGDYGFNNLLVDGDRVTGVLDWGEAKYGDFLYDVAWLDMWSPGTGYQARFADYYTEHGRAVPHFEARIRCYQAYIGLDGLRFFAKSGDEQSYQWVRSRLSTIFPDT